jgi:hypothetical protein
MKEEKKGAVRYKMVQEDGLVMKMARHILKTFNEEFEGVSINDIQICWRISKHWRYAGQVRRITGANRMFTNKMFVLILFKPFWDENSRAKRALLLYHELKHIYKKDNGQYSLRRHDIEDFLDIVRKYGSHWQHADKFLHVLERRGHA